MQIWNYKIWLIFFCFFLPVSLFGDEKEQVSNALIYPDFDLVKFLEYDPNTHRGLPILRETDTSLAKIKVLKNLLENSFPSQSVKLYFLAQNYLFNTGQVKKIEPVYLLLSDEKGGYAKKGFYLRNEKRNRVNKSDYYYIDYYKKTEEPENYLGSFTQNFPHELSHVISNLLSNTSEQKLPKTVNVHYSSIITDYRTAFNEGFSIHFENIAREQEPNQKLKNDILQDAELKRAKSDRFLRGYLRDFYLPIRLDYYRIIAIMWYNTFEMLKRKDWVRNDWFKFKVKETSFNNSEKGLFYRNSGIQIDSSQLMNYQQLLSTEGLIASFFEELVNSKLANNYQEPEFYDDFLVNSAINVKPKEIFTPLENQYLKIFVVINRYLNDLKTHQAPLIEFIDGYLCEFPDEKGVVMRIFEKVTGYYYDNIIGPEIWLLNKDYKHGRLILDQFGGNRLNYYTFNINAAGKEDLSTIKDLKNQEIDSILKYRDLNNFFDSINEINLIPGLSEKGKAAILSCVYDQDFVDNNKEKLDIYSVVIYGLARLIEKGLFYLMLFITFYYLLFYGKSHVVKVLTIKYVIRKILKLYLLIFLGLISVVISNEPLQMFLIFSVIFLSIELLSRKREKNRKDAFYTSFVLIVMIMFSLW